MRFFFLLRPRPPSSPLFPYTTLFRSSNFGLLASIWTRDTRRGKRIAEQLEAGTVLINDVIYTQDRKSTRLNSSHVEISYAVFCLKKKTRRPGDERDCDDAMRDRQRAA